jgi:hypothetical protein
MVFASRLVNPPYVLYFGMALAAALLALALRASAAAVPEAITPVGDILKNRDRSNGASFCVVGKPVEMDERVGRATGKHLFRGKLDDGTGRVEIFAFGWFPPVALGEKIEVCGKFNRFKIHRNGVGYHDEIEAAAILKGKGIASGLVVVGKTVVMAPKEKKPL